jgi:hypothetical protein
MMVMEDESSFLVTAVQTFIGAVIIGVGVGIGYHLGSSAYQEMSHWWSKTPEERKAGSHG